MVADPVERAKEWVRQERANGLVDVKFFPGSARDVLVENVLRDFMQAIELRERNHVTNLSGVTL